MASDNILNSPFKTIYDTYLQASQMLVDSSINNLINALTPVITTGLVLYVMITGYMVIAGRIQDPISDVLIKLSKWTIIAFIALNAGTITNNLIGGFNGLENTILSGFSYSKDGVFETLDDSFKDGLLAAAEAQSQKSGLSVGVGSFSVDVPDPASTLAGLAISMSIMIATLIQTFLAAGVIILAKISLLVVFALAPLMLSGLFFPQTSRFADAWFNQCFNYVLTGIIAAFIVTISSSLFSSSVEAINNEIKTGSYPIISVGIMLVIACANCFAVKQAPNIASGLAGGVASGSASLMGAARTLASAATGVGVVGGALEKGIRRGGSAAFNFTKNNAGRAANAALHTAAAIRNPRAVAARAAAAARNAPKSAAQNASRAYNRGRDRVSNAWQRANANVRGENRGGGNTIKKQ